MTTLSYDALVAKLICAADVIEENKNDLAKLDSFGGDGDHGPTMARAMGNMKDAITAAKPGAIKPLLLDIAWAIMGVDGGATGPLFGSFFMGMSEGVADVEELDAPALATAFEAGLANLRAQTKAAPGDKTIIDAFVPAVEALRASVDAGDDIATALNKAAEGAAQGAEATKQMQAKFGRARSIGEGSIGNPDAGATSVSLIFKAIAEGA